MIKLNNLKGISGALPRHLVDILSGILFTFVKEYPQLTNSVLHQILIKSDFQPFLITQPTAESQPNSQLTREQKASFIKSVMR